MISIVSPIAWTFISAELVLLLTRSRDIMALTKSRRQRTHLEQHEINRGLARAILLEALLFVPASCLLLVLISPLVLPSSFFANPQNAVASSSLLGIASYGFPFATVKRLITRLALATLREFADLLPSEVQAEMSKEPPK